MGKRGSKWSHGWVPRNGIAALMKAHGSSRGAARLLGHKTTSAVTRVKARHYTKAGRLRRR